ncbi:MAG: hypothetical protein KatS3mg105_3471 [Gemmatales bacterium]|nr:MAG: hypothetical protein KatS3mg105_3471 [Gemmatales bacterium]
MNDSANLCARFEAELAEHFETISDPAWQAHLASCFHCQQMMKWEEKLRRDLPGLAFPETPKTIRDRVRKRVRRRRVLTPTLVAAAASILVVVSSFLLRPPRLEVNVVTTDPSQSENVVLCQVQTAVAQMPETRLATDERQDLLLSELTRMVMGDKP